MFSRLSRGFKNSNIVGRFIYANVAVYVIVVFIGVFSVLFNFPSLVENCVGTLELSSSFHIMLCRPWSLFTYMFLHEQLMHLLWNMLALYMFGKVFMSFYSVRHFVGTYLLGGLFGGLFFLLSFNTLPYFAPYIGGVSLVGASASVLAIIVASAVRSPGYRVHLFLFGSVKLSTLAIVSVGISVLMLSGENAGGNFAHIGGAFAGWLMASLLNKGVDITSFVNRPIDYMVSLFGKKTKKRKKGKFHYSSSTAKHSSDYEYNASKKVREAEVDCILEKIKKGGYSSLSDEEKKRLFEASSK
jgi:membrane associated rhomboid family serine protease